MRRIYLRGRENISKRQLIHVGAFNLGLVLRHKPGAGTPRELRNRQQRLVFVFIRFASLLRRTRRLPGPVDNTFDVSSPQLRRWAREIVDAEFQGFCHRLLI
jgi:transposase